MSDENQDIQTWIDPELEARVVAWVVGEASEFEAAELGRIIAEKPELAIFKRRIEAVHELVAASARMDLDPMRLSPDRREKLIETLGGKAASPVVAMPAEKRKPRIPWQLAAFAAVVAVLALLSGLLFPPLNSARNASFAAQKLNDEKAALTPSNVQQGQQQLYAEAAKRTLTGANTFSGATRINGGALSTAAPAAPTGMTVTGGGYGFAGGGAGGEIAASAAPAPTEKEMFATLGSLKATAARDEASADATGAETALAELGTKRRAIAEADAEGSKDYKQAHSELSWHMDYGSQMPADKFGVASGDIALKREASVYAQAAAAAPASMGGAPAPSTAPVLGDVPVPVFHNAFRPNLRQPAPPAGDEVSAADQP